MRFFIITLTYLLGTFEVSAGSFYNNSHRGWFWFESQPKEVENLSEQQNLTGSNSTTSAGEMLREFQEKMDEARAAMIMTPSIQKTRIYSVPECDVFKKRSGWS